MVNIKETARSGHVHTSLHADLFGSHLGLLTPEEPDVRFSVGVLGRILSSVRNALVSHFLLEKEQGF